jgi:two-component system chemotaxis response regulator CheB
LSAVLTGLPTGFACPILIVQHLDPRRPSLLATLLGRCTPLAIRQAQEGDPVQPGIILVAPPDRHLIVNADHTVSLSHTDTVHFLRPSAEPLFLSVASAFQARAIAVVLSGTGLDGSAGIPAVKRAGGATIVEDPATAEYPGMPSAAIHTGCVDHILPLPMIAPMLIGLANTGSDHDSSG